MYICHSCGEELPIDHACKMRIEEDGIFLVIIFIVQNLKYALIVVIIEMFAKSVLNEVKTIEEYLIMCENNKEINISQSTFYLKVLLLGFS